MDEQPTSATSDTAWTKRAERVVGSLQPYASPTLSASEIGGFAFCPQAWFLGRCNVPVDEQARLRLEAGRRAHRGIGLRTDLLRASERIQPVLVAGMLLLALALTLVVIAGGTLLMLVLILTGLFLSCAVTSVALAAWTRQERQRLGLRGGRILAADDSRFGSPTLRSERLGLAARPDHVLELGGMRIPVEQKPSAQRVWPSHALQVSAQCALLEEVSGVRPSHAVVVLAKGQHERVAFTPQLEQQLFGTMQRMREILDSREAPGPCWSRGRCTSCGYRQICWGVDTPVAPAPATHAC
jgi:CRISPR-associated protein Cas4